LGRTTGISRPPLARPPLKPSRCVTIGGREIPVVLPNRRDPRLRLSAVIFTLQVLGQTVLGFKLSIAQILVTIGVCAVTEVVLTYRNQRMLVWPASGILTGNSIAFILRASGTQPGDWWSLRGIHFFVLAAVIAMLTKHLIRPRGRHLFNPSNVGIVWCLLVIGPVHVFPQYLWWGEAGSLPVITAMAVILVGGWWVLKSVRMIPMAVSFLVTFGVLVALYAAAGRQFVAIWREGPVSGFSYWANIALSPELLIFVFFMISDPQTSPKAPRGRIAYGMATAVVAAGLLWFQDTEFGIKLAMLSSLTLVCAVVPFIEWANRWWSERRAQPAPGEAAALRPDWRRLRAAALTPVVVVSAILAVAAPLDTARLAGNEDVMNIELGLTGPRNAQ